MELENGISSVQRFYTVPSTLPLAATQWSRRWLWRGRSQVCFLSLGEEGGLVVKARKVKPEGEDRDGGMGVGRGQK